MAATPRTPSVYVADPSRLQESKNPDVFNTHTVVLDDDLGFYPSQLLTSGNHTFFPIIPFGGPSPGLIQMSFRKLVPLDESIIPRIEKAFLEVQQEGK